MVKNLRNQIYLKYNVREYFENIVSLKDKVVVDWGCNHGNMLEYQPCDFDYIGLDIDKYIIEQNRSKWPQHEWIHMDAHNHQYHPHGGNEWAEIRPHDLVLMFSIFTHMDVDTMHEYIGKMEAPLLSTFIPSNDKEKLQTALGYRLTSDLYTQVLDKPFCYIVATPDDVLIYENIRSMPFKDPKIWYFLVVHHPDYMRQYGEIIDTPYETGIRNTQLCLSVK
jgi:hypothetical protein|tara:strand:+ start:7819 stop:8484 length:666 start_codon:yes stop_codon:yes gene_type:complete